MSASSRVRFVDRSVADVEKTFFPQTTTVCSGLSCCPSSHSSSTTTAGRLVLLGSTPDIYMHEWASFSTKGFPENRLARSGETVRIVMKDVEDARPVVDTIWFPHDYQELFGRAGFEIASEHRPLGRAEEPYPWVSETSIAPWVVYVLRPHA